MVDLRSNRSKSKSPSAQRKLSEQATSTTGYNNGNGGTGIHKSRTPSPVRARQSPTSTSSPRYCDSVSDKKGTTPPPPPRISDDIKGNKKEDRKILNKTVKRGRHDSVGKARSNFLKAEAASDKIKKPRQEESSNKTEEQNKNSLGTLNKKASNVPSGSKSQNVERRLKSGNGDNDSESNSSPSPPPVNRENKDRTNSKDKDKTSSGINFKVKARPKIKKEKNPFRIPKKGKGDNTRHDTRTPSPQSFTNEGPLVEFNEGRSPSKGGKRQGGKSNSIGQPKNKKIKSNE